jgi:hypothetical protein
MYELLFPNSWPKNLGASKHACGLYTPNYGILKYYLGTFLQGLRKIMKAVDKDRQSFDWHSHLNRVEYGSDAVTADAE